MEASHAADPTPPNGECSEAAVCDYEAATNGGVAEVGAGAALGDEPQSDGAAHRRTKEELAAEIVRQVEFYFSDANLPTDAFMLKQVHSNPDGWVPIKVLASFNKMKKLTRKLNVICEALRGSKALDVSPEGQRVRRKAALPNVDLDAVRLCTVMADNLPEKPTIEMVMEKFGAAGEVAMVRICKPDASEPLLTKGMRSEVSFSNKTYALVEYRTPEQAQRAVAMLNDTTNWRTGLRVRPLLKEAPQRSKDKQHGRAQQAQQGQHARQQQPQHVQEAAPAPPPPFAAAAPPLPPAAAPSAGPAAAAGVQQPQQQQQQQLPSFDAMPPVPPIVAASTTAAVAPALTAAATAGAPCGLQPAPQSLAPLPASAAADGWVSLNILQAAGFSPLEGQPLSKDPAPAQQPLNADAAPWPAPQRAPFAAISLASAASGAGAAAPPPAGNAADVSAAGVPAAATMPAAGPSLADTWRAAGAQADDSDEEGARPRDHSEGGGFMQPGEWKSLNIIEQLLSGPPPIRTQQLDAQQKQQQPAQQAQQRQQQQQQVAAGLPQAGTGAWAPPTVASPNALSPTSWAARAAAAAPRMLSPRAFSPQGGWSPGSHSPNSRPPAGSLPAGAAAAPIKAAAAAPQGLAGLAAATQLPPDGLSAAAGQLRGLSVGSSAAREGSGESAASMPPPPPPPEHPPPPPSPSSQWGHHPQAHLAPHDAHHGSHGAYAHSPQHPQTHHNGHHSHHPQTHHHGHHSHHPQTHHGTPPRHPLHHPQTHAQGTPPHKRHEWEAGPRRTKADYAAWASGSSARAARESGAASGSESVHSAHSTTANSSVVHKGPGGVLFVGAARQPTMPDGTRGFAMGRGRLLPPPPGTVAAT